MTEKPFLSIGCNSLEFGTGEDPWFVSIGGELLNHDMQRIAESRDAARWRERGRGSELAAGVASKCMFMRDGERRETERESGCANV